MKKINIAKAISYMLIVLTMCVYMACQPDEFGDGNGLSDPSVAASFTVTKVEGKVNTYVLKSNNEGVLGVKWNKDDGLDFNFGRMIDTVYYPDAGTYTVTLEAIGKGGIVATSAPQEIVVETSDPV